MSNDNNWIVDEITIDEGGNLVIDATPGYANRKRWEGAMAFHLPAGKLDDLLRQIEEHKAQDRMIEVAADEMKEFLEIVKSDYLEKRRILAEKLNLDVADIPTPCWYGFDNPNEVVRVLNKRLFN